MSAFFGREGPAENISWEKEGHILCDFRFSSSFQKINMILLTRPEGCLIGRISLIKKSIKREDLPGRPKRVGEVTD